MASYKYQGVTAGPSAEDVDFNSLSLFLEDDPPDQPRRPQRSRPAGRAARKQIPTKSVVSAIERIRVCKDEVEFDHLIPLQPSLEHRDPQQLKGKIKSLGSKYLQVKQSICDKHAATWNGPPKCPQHDRLLSLWQVRNVANGMVWSRAVLDKWEYGLRAIENAKASRDPEKLSEELERWSFSHNHPQVVQASQTLQLWREQRVPELQGALKSCDVVCLGELIKTSTMKPHDEPLELKEAKKIMKQSLVKRDALVKVACARDRWCTKQALQTWPYNDDFLFLTIARMDLPSLKILWDSYLDCFPSVVSPQVAKEAGATVVELARARLKLLGLREIAEATRLVQMALQEGTVESLRRVQGALEDTKVRPDATYGLRQLVSESQNLNELRQAVAANHAESIRQQLAWCIQIDVPKHRIGTIILSGITELKPNSLVVLLEQPTLPAKFKDAVKDAIVWHEALERADSRDAIEAAAGKVKNSTACFLKEYGLNANAISQKVVMMSGRFCGERSDLVSTSCSSSMPIATRTHSRASTSTRCESATPIPPKGKRLQRLVPVADKQDADTAPVSYKDRLRATPRLSKKAREASVPKEWNSQETIKAQASKEVEKAEVGRSATAPERTSYNGTAPRSSKVAAPQRRLTSGGITLSDETSPEEASYKERLLGTPRSPRRSLKKAAPTRIETIILQLSKKERLTLWYCVAMIQIRFREAQRQLKAAWAIQQKWWERMRRKAAAKDTPQILKKIDQARQDLSKTWSPGQKATTAKPQPLSKATAEPASEARKPPPNRSTTTPAIDRKNEAEARTPTPTGTHARTPTPEGRQEGSSQENKAAIALQRTWRKKKTQGFGGDAAPVLKVVLRVFSAVGFTLGGQNSNRVTEGHNRVQKGWKLLLINGEKLPVQNDGSPLTPVMMKKHIEKELQTKRCDLLFEVDAKTGREQVEKRKRVEKQLMEERARRLDGEPSVMKRLGANDLYGVEKMDAKQRAERLRDTPLFCSILQHGALYEAEVLAQKKSAVTVMSTIMLIEALKADSLTDIVALLPDADLQQRDERGSVPLHFARSTEAVQMLVEQCPAAVSMSNSMGQKPLHTYVHFRETHDIASLSLLAEPREALLEMDSQGICPAMRLQGRARTWAEKFMPAWNEIFAALVSKTSDEIVAALKAMPNWQNALAVHLFGFYDLLNKGDHTECSKMRSRVVWKALDLLFEDFSNQSAHAEEPLRELLQATKGPHCRSLDTRGPYRQDLEKWISKLQAKSDKSLEQEYKWLQADGNKPIIADDHDAYSVKWLLGLSNSTSKDLVDDGLAFPGWDPNVRMDFQAQDRDGDAVKAIHGLIVPEWVMAERIEGISGMIGIDEALQEVGVVKPDSNPDHMYQLLQICGLGDSAAQDDDLIIARCYAAWIRGCCECRQQAISKAMTNALGSAAIPGVTFFARRDAKGFPRMWEKTLWWIKKIHEHHKGLDATALKRAVRQAPSLISDVNGCEFVADVAELQNAHERLSKSPDVEILQTYNKYLSDVERPPANYRDLKLLVAVSTEKGSRTGGGALHLSNEGTRPRLVVETQFHVKSFYAEKKWMHLPYELVRGSLDWPEEEEQPPLVGRKSSRKGQAQPKKSKSDSLGRNGRRK